MKEQIIEKILKAIGNGYTDHICRFNDGECKCECYGQALADLRTRAPQLAENLLDIMYPEYNQAQIRTLVKALEFLNIPEKEKEYNFIRNDLLKRFKKSLKS
jgi:hypothetical protein